MPPKTVVIIGILALTWFIVRIYMRRVEEHRALEREERMARLMVEREEILARRQDEAPNSLQAVVSDEGDARAPATKEKATVKVRCKSCRALNDEDAQTCASCGKPL